MVLTRTLILVAVCFLAVTSLAAQHIPNTNFVMNVDYARFKYDDQSFYLEIYYGFYPKLVTLNQSASGFSGGIILKTTISNNATNIVVRKEHSLLPVSFPDTTGISGGGDFLTQAGYALPFGEYQLQVTAVDSLDPTRMDSISLSLSVKPFAQTATVSDLELCGEIKSSQDKSNAFYKNSLEVVPNAALLFGITAHPVVFHYVELYNLEPGKRYGVRSRLVDASEKVVRDVSRQRTFGVSNAVDVGTMNVTALASGKYKFFFSLEEEGKGELASMEKSFFIYNPHLKVPDATAAEIKSGELSGLTADELAAEFRQAQYLATTEEIKIFSRISNIEGRREFLAKFWVEAEIGKSGKPAITRAEYLRRVTIANQRYRSQGREGWLTERGRVYILYGEPGELERMPSQNNAKPHEIWHYYSLENGVLFVFVDRTGFGDYTLVHSTKRGELQDENWQRNLQ
ncbi:MAG: GWxTD domain-containing protein [Ignavibacteriae bacterium]|nr:GWxTD domain-containing protein [Ignavibacteriota bacterium]